MRQTPLLSSMLAPGEQSSTYVVRGRGVELTLSDGRTVLDGGSLSSCIVGHCHPEVVRAVREAAGSVYVADGNGYAPRDQAAEDLLRYAFGGEDWAEGVVLFISSSEAADLGLLLAQTLTGREALVCRERGYHGAVGLARAVSAHPLWSPKLAPLDGTEELYPPPALAEVRRLPVPECGLGGAEREHDHVSTCLRDAPGLLDNAAAFIMDSTQGGVCPPGSYHDALAAEARRAGAYWIADETVTGFGRLGYGFAFQRGSARPDMVTLGKGITGAAAPGGALILSRDVLDAIGERRWTTSSTFRGHPVAVAAISATMRVLQKEALVQRAAALGAELGRELESLAARHPCVSRLVGEGMMRLLYLQVPDWRAEGRWEGGRREGSLPELVHREALARGAWVGVFSGQSVWLIPPLVISRDQLDHVVEALDGALTVADQELERGGRATAGALGDAR